MTRPTIHINGTSKESLTEQYSNAARAVDQAIEVLCKSAPHGRDYYPQGDETLLEAQKEHYNRIERLDSVKKELDELAIYCYNT